MVCRSAFSRLPTAQSEIEARHRLQPATSPDAFFECQSGAAETLHSRVFGAYRQVEPRTRNAILRSSADGAEETTSSADTECRHLSQRGRQRNELLQKRSIQKRKARFVPSFAIWVTLRSGYRDPRAGSVPLRDRTHRAYRTGDSDPSDSGRRRSARNSPARSPCHRVRRPSDA